MSIKVNEALFDLIHSLTKSEKRYFKLMSSRHTIGDENNYIRLFDAIGKQSTYSEEELFSFFKGEAFLNRFSITKKRLYDHILFSLDSFHSSNSIDAQLYKMLHSFDILFEKSLYEQSRRVLRSAEKLAGKHQKDEILLLIFKKEKKLIETEGNSSVDNVKITEHTNKVRGMLDEVKTYNNFWEIKSKLFLLMSKKGIARCAEDVGLYKEICSELFLQKQDIKNYGGEINYLYHHTLSAYYYAIGDLQKSLDYLQENLRMFEDKSQTPVVEPNRQVSVYTNAIYVADRLGYHHQSIHYLTSLKKMAATIESNEDLEVKLFSSISSIEFSLCIRRGDFSTAQKIAEKVAVQLSQYGDKITPLRRAFLEFKLAVVSMGTGDYSKALQWVNRILNNPELDKTEDIVGFTQLLDLLVHIELNHDKLLPYSLKSTLRFLKTRNRLYNFEKVFLQFIGKLIKCTDQFEIQNLWEELYNDLAAITDNDFESIALEYFDFQSWAESKLKRKSFDAVIKEKYNETIKSAS